MVTVTLLVSMASVPRKMCAAVILVTKEKYVISQVCVLARNKKKKFFVLLLNRFVTCR